MEVTRVIQIEVTQIVDSKDIGGDTPDIRPAEWMERDIRHLFRQADQVNVTVKDFVRDDNGTDA